MADATTTPAPVASKPLTASQRAEKLEGQVQELLPKVGALEAENAALVAKVAEQDKELGVVRGLEPAFAKATRELEDLRNVRSRVKLGQWIKLYFSKGENPMSGGAAHHDEPAAPAHKKPSGGGGGSGGFGGGLGKLLTTVALIAAAVVFIGGAGWIIWGMFNHGASPASVITAPAEVIPPAPTETVSADADHVDASTSNLLSEKTCSEPDMIYVEGIGCVLSVDE